MMPSPESAAQALRQAVGWHPDTLGPVPVIAVAETAECTGVHRVTFRDPQITCVVLTRAGGPTLYVARDLAPTGQRFAIAHALAHWVQDLRPLDPPRLSVVDRHDPQRLYCTGAPVSPREAAANALAAALIVPRAALAWPVPAPELPTILGVAPAVVQRWGRELAEGAWL
jgi:Zn-dependent peptidase ImmA (M78 family)